MNLHESLAFWIRDPRSKEDRDWSKIPNKPPIESVAVTSTGAKMLEEIHTVLHQGMPDTPVLLVSMPLGRTHIKPETWSTSETFLAESQRIFGNDPQFTLLDARDIAAPERYYTATHLDAQGHDEVARYLLPEVLKHTARDGTDGI